MTKKNACPRGSFAFQGVNDILYLQLKLLTVGLRRHPWSRN